MIDLMPQSTGKEMDPQAIREGVLAAREVLRSVPRIIDPSEQRAIVGNYAYLVDVCRALTRPQYIERLRACAASGDFTGLAVLSLDQADAETQKDRQAGLLDADQAVNIAAGIRGTRRALVSAELKGKVPARVLRSSRIERAPDWLLYLDEELQAGKSLDDVCAALESGNLTTEKDPSILRIADETREREERTAR